MNNIKSISQILFPLLLLSGCCDEDEYIYIPAQRNDVQGARWNLQFRRPVSVPNLPAKGLQPWQG